MPSVFEGVDLTESKHSPAPRPAKKRRVAPPRGKRAAPVKIPAPSATIPLTPLDAPVEDSTKKIPLTRQKMIDLLEAYGRDRDLSPVLSNQGWKLNATALNTTSDKKLQVMCASVDSILNGEFKSDSVDEAIQWGLSNVEYTAAHYTGLPIHGTTAACFNNRRWRMLFARQKIRMGIGLIKMDPFLELMLLTGTIAHGVISDNNGSQGIDLDKPLPESDRDSGK